jgi:aspartate aminotransferase
VTCAANFVQHAGIEALEQSAADVTHMVDAFRERRDLLVDLLEENGTAIRRPDGAFYLMAPVADDDKSWCERALQDAHVATVPGSAFGTPGYARFSYTCGTERLREGIDRLVENGLL